ncbi:methionine biosynthesis protein MetW [Parvularcula dongshanensis]|uniref:Methionine biosynthesis protein MetW n=1 Tax=Parvularcula dongshanensis TaxID=1173995 RepID=A0A840I0N9_9PROT|nr:methionine biosynthesis protein MetW [Parvularcula dongshanensis]
MPTTTSRYDVIASLVPHGARVLDVGCGDGTLLRRLAEERGAQGYGLEIDAGAVSAAVAQGLSVVQGDADTDLQDYPDGAFDAVILSNSVQALRDPIFALRQAVRVGKRAVVAFPNFGHWRIRGQLLLSGRMPRSRALPASWYETQNIHLCTVLDFLDLCRDGAFVPEAAYGLSDRRARRFDPSSPKLSNLRAQEAVFALSAGT